MKNIQHCSLKIYDNLPVSRDKIYGKGIKEKVLYQNKAKRYMISDKKKSVSPVDPFICDEHNLF